MDRNGLLHGDSVFSGCLGAKRHAQRFALVRNLFLQRRQPVCAGLRERRDGVERSVGHSLELFPSPMFVEAAPHPTKDELVPWFDRIVCGAHRARGQGRCEANIQMVSAADGHAEFFAFPADALAERNGLFGKINQL